MCNLLLMMIARNLQKMKESEAKLNYLYSMGALLVLHLRLVSGNEEGQGWEKGRDIWSPRRSRIICLSLHIIRLR